MAALRNVMLVQAGLLRAMLVQTQLHIAKGLMTVAWVAGCRAVFLGNAIEK